MNNVTVGMLIYQSKRWLDFSLNSLAEAKNKTPFNTFVLANDPTDEIAADPRVTYVHRSPDPNEYYINRVYRAWNKLVEMANTELVCLVNSDMAFSDGWLDALVECFPGGHIPTSRLVESGQIPSAMHEWVHDFGRTPETFDYAGWKAHAAELSLERKVSPGRLFMPVLLSRTVFLVAKGYPPGNIGGQSGDAIFFRNLGYGGLKHITVHHSVVYHAQEGEMRNP